jgi:hypothetical protein
MTHKTIVKKASAALPEKQAKRPDFQGFLHGEPRREPVNIGVLRQTFFQTSNSGRKSRSA